MLLACQEGSVRVFQGLSGSGKGLSGSFRVCPYPDGGTSAAQEELAALEAQRADAEAALEAAQSRRRPGLLHRLTERRFVLARGEGHRLPGPEVRAYESLVSP